MRRNQRRTRSLPRTKLPDWMASNCVRKQIPKHKRTKIQHQWIRTTSVVWSLEHFKYYLYISRFILQTDHQAILSALKDSRGNKTYQSRLTRWVDRLLPFNFSVEQLAGKNMGFADYFSRHPISAAITISKDDENFVINLIDYFKFMLKRAERISSNRITANTPAQYDIIKTSERKRKKQNAFSQFRCTKQSRSINPLFVNVCTRNNPNINTFEQNIIKRFRGPNKKTLSSPNQTENPPDNPQTSKFTLNPKAITIGTQTDYISNIGQGLNPLNPKIVKNPFEQITLENSLITY